MSSLTILYDLPEELRSSSAADLWRYLPGPTLIHLRGRREVPLFVSILLHGNEDVGLRAVQQVLREHARRDLPRSMSLFVGNVAAARAGVRRLDDQPDYNRVWPDGDDGRTAEHATMRQVVAEMERRRVFASIDLHNNTGLNPHYACVNCLESAHLHLAALFSRTVVYFRLPRGVQSMAFGRFCPAVTCECGKVGDTAGVARAAEFITTCLHLSELPTHAVTSGDVHLFHTVARVTVPAGTTFTFAADDAQLSFPPNLESFNFQELGANTVLANRRPESNTALEVRDESGRDVSDEFLTVGGDVIRLKKPVMPSMLTSDAQVIGQDCLCYFMERLALPTGE